MVTAVEREAVKVAQTILAESTGGTLLVDGKWGTYTQKVFDDSSDLVRKRITAVLTAYDTNPASLRAAYRAESMQNPNAKASYVEVRALERVAATVPLSVRRAENKRIFDTVVVPLVIAKCIKQGINAQIAVAQLRLESANGTATSARHNYGGIKALPGQKTEYADTQEFIGGRMVGKREPFRSFNTPEEFVDAYIQLITNRRYGAAYRMVDNLDAANAIRAAGYATDPSYAKKLAGIADSVQTA